MLSWELSLIKVKVVVNVRSDAKEVVQGLGLGVEVLDILA